MTDTEIAQYILDTFPDVETTENFGYKFFFYGAERMLPFATLIAADNAYDRASDLNRPGVYRLNIGVSRETFRALFGSDKPDVSQYDFTTLDRIMPHPDYAPQNWICVLSPTRATLEKVKEFLEEAYEIARARSERKVRSE